MPLERSPFFVVIEVTFGSVEHVFTVVLFARLLRSLQ